MKACRFAPIPLLFDSQERPIVTVSTIVFRDAQPIYVRMTPDNHAAIVPPITTGIHAAISAGTI
jgi:hypothetical protein